MEGGKVSEVGPTFERDGSSLGESPQGTNVNAGPAPGPDPTPAQASSRHPSRRNKKVYKYVDLASFASPAPASRQPTVTPAEFRSQTNGVPPMATRNPEYAPVVGQPGQNMHRTFGNMFQSMAARPRPDGYRKNEFAMKADEFPSLK